MTKLEIKLQMPVRVSPGSWLTSVENLSYDEFHLYTTLLVPGGVIHLSWKETPKKNGIYLEGVGEDSEKLPLPPNEYEAAYNAALEFYTAWVTKGRKLEDDPFDEPDLDYPYETDY